jgi:hypothetical protein
MIDCPSVCHAFWPALGLEDAPPAGPTLEEVEANETIEVLMKLQAVTLKMPYIHAANGLPPAGGQASLMNAGRTHWHCMSCK